MHDIFCCDTINIDRRKKMLAKIDSYGLSGLVGYKIDVEVDINQGLPSYDVVGLPDASVKESKERVHSAIKTV